MKKVLVFSDVDGTILDYRDHDFRDALPGIERCRDEDFSLILASSKTRSEMTNLVEELDLHQPFIFENGGGICWPQPGRSRGDRVAYLGTSSNDLNRMLPRLEKIFGKRCIPMEQLGIDGIMELTGLSLEQARFSMDRETDLPFVFEPHRDTFSIDDRNISVALKEIGLGLTVGKRFMYCAALGVTKGKAAKKVVEDYRAAGYTVISAAVGDGINDFPLFEAVDFGYLVRGRDGSYPRCSVPGVTVTSGRGPAGFCEAIEAIKERIA